VANPSHRRHLTLLEGGFEPSPPRAGTPDRHHAIAEQQGDEMTLPPMKRADDRPMLDALHER
jgi:hypothetical protein